MKYLLIVVAVLFFNRSLMADSPTTSSSDYESATAWYRAIVTGPQAFADFDFNAWAQYVDTDSSATVRDVALTNILLCKENQQKAIPIITRRFQLESDDSIKRSLISDLGECGEYAQARDALISVFNKDSESQAIRLAALDALITSGDSRVVSVMYDYLNSGDNNKETLALQNLPRFKDNWNESGKMVLVLFKSSMASSNDDLAKASLICLTDCNYTPAVHDLLSTLEDNRDSHKLWPELIAATDKLQPSAGSDLVAVLQNEDDQIRKAQLANADFNSSAANAHQQWMQNVQQEKDRRAKMQQDALAGASGQWFKNDPLGFRKEFAADFVSAFIATRQTNFTYDQQNVEMGELDNSKGQDTTIGNLKSDIRKYYVSVPIVSTGNDGDTSSQVIFTFKDNSDQTGLQYIQCVQKNGTVETFLHPTGTEDIIASVEKNMGKNYKGFVDPTSNMLPIERMYPEPNGGVNSNIPQRSRHIT